MNSEVILHTFFITNDRGNSHFLKEQWKYDHYLHTDVTKQNMSGDSQQNSVAAFS